MTLAPLQRVGTILVVGVGVSLLAGCANGAPDAPRSAAQAFESAWSRHDGAAVCRLLAPETQAEVAENGKAPCAQVILDEDLPAATRARSTQVWGRSAQVKTVDDVLFLAEFSQGWRVVAAGCQPQPGKPYDCQIQGG